MIRGEGDLMKEVNILVCWNGIGLLNGSVLGHHRNAMFVYYFNFTLYE
jgi:hypothetical protein